MELWIGQLNKVYTDLEWTRLHPNFIQIRDAISLITKGTFDSENQKIQLLDSTVFDAIIAKRPKSDKKVHKIARLKAKYDKNHFSDNYNTSPQTISHSKALSEAEIQKHQIVKTTESKCKNCGKAIGKRKGRKWCGDACRKQFTRNKSKLNTTQQSSGWTYKSWKVDRDSKSVTQGSVHITNGDDKITFSMETRPAKYDDGRENPHFTTDKEIKETIDFLMEREPKAKEMASFHNKPWTELLFGPDAHFDAIYQDYKDADKSEAEKEAAEHPETFEKIQAGEIKSPTDLGESIAAEHAKAEKADSWDAAKYESLVDINDHSQAAVYLATHFGTPDQVDRLIGIRNQHLRYGSIPKDLQTERDNIANEIYNKAFIKKNVVSDKPTPEDIETLEATQIDIKATPQKKKDYYTFNRNIEQLIDQKGDAGYSADEKAFIALYSGYGGLIEYMGEEAGNDTKILFEFFTPQEIVKTMWGLAYKYGYKGGPVFEPSAGTGAFLQYAPRDAKIDAVELNPYSAKILKVLYPNANVVQGKLENRFIVNRKSVKGKVKPEYDLVIGNPPFGKFSGTEAAFEKKYTSAEKYEDYFMTRSLDLLKPGGLLIFIIGTPKEIGGIPFLDKKMNKSKKEIIEKSKLLDAYRLPTGVFDRTNVSSDIIVLQKK